MTGLDMAQCSSQAAGARATTDGSVVITLPEEVDTSNVGQIRDMLTAELRDGLTVLVADATATTFFGASGVTVLMSAHRQARKAGTQFRLAASPSVRRILNLTGADQILQTYAGLSEAVAGQQPDASRGQAAGR